MGKLDSVKNFLKSDSTDVTTDVEAPVTHETHHHHEREEVSQEVDRERHIHHYQERVQPLKEEDIRGEKHFDNVVGVQESERSSHNQGQVEAHLSKLHGQHADAEEHVRHDREVLQGGVAGEQEHVHHHIHETVQPVIDKDIHHKKVVHTTIPVHEKIVEAPVMHETQYNPVLTTEEWEAKMAKEGGKLGQTHTLKEGQVPQTKSRDGGYEEFPGNQQGDTTGAGRNYIGGSGNNTSGVDSTPRGVQSSSGGFGTDPGTAGPAGSNRDRQAVENDVRGVESNRGIGAV